MPEAAEAPISSVLGEQREGLSFHAFRGGNAFMLLLLNRYRDELSLTAPADELEASATRTAEHSATIRRALTVSTSVSSPAVGVVVDVEVHNLAGHKLPTAYPSRRAWLHLTLRAQDGAVLFESGAIRPDGSIAGNDNDADPGAFETNRFVGYYETNAAESAVVLATAEARQIRSEDRK